jgi:hypothetical protein
MLNISHKQTTAYHPESNGAVERLHRRLKDALCTRAAAATWSEELPFVLLGLRAQLREDTGLYLAEAVFGSPIVLPNEILQNDELSVDSIIKFFSKILHVPASSCLGTILAPSSPAKCQPNCSLPPSSGSVGAASFHLFSCSMMAPTRFCAVAPAPSPSESVHGMRWSPSAALRPARQRTPSLAARVAAAGRLARAQVVLPQSSGSRFQTRWFFHLLLLLRRHKTVPEPFSYLARRFCMPRTGGSFTASTVTVPALSTGTAQEFRPLTSSPPSRGQSSGGVLWRAAYAPGDGQTSSAYSSHPVQYLYINC